jgi:hypothetical protein
MIQRTSTFASGGLAPYRRGHRTSRDTRSDRGSLEFRVIKSVERPEKRRGIIPV